MSALDIESATRLKRLGYASVINLRRDSEPDAEIDAQARIVRAAGLRFIHIPFSADALDDLVVSTFLSAVTRPMNVPAFIHCRTGNRAAALWAIKRIKIDQWAYQDALDEALRLGLTSDSLSQSVRLHAGCV